MIKSKRHIIRITRGEPNFDKACEIAYDRAVSIFKIDGAGHAADKRFDRSSSDVKVRFKSYTHTGTMVGHEYEYKFVAWMTRYDDENEY